MRGSRYLDHARHCATCEHGRLCPTGRQILTSKRGTAVLPPVPVSQAATAVVNVNSLIIGSAL